MAATQLKPTEKRRTTRSGEMLFSGECGLVMSFWKNLRESGHFWLLHNVSNSLERWVLPAWIIAKGGKITRSKNGKLDSPWMPGAAQDSCAGATTEKLHGVNPQVLHAALGWRLQHRSQARTTTYLLMWPPRALVDTVGSVALTTC